MTDKELDEIMTRLTSANDHKKQIQLAKANAEITTIQREADAYWNGVYDAIKEIKNALPQHWKGEKETIFCKDCEHLMFSDCYGECSKGHKGIVKPNDTCKYATRKLPKGE